MRRFLQQVSISRLAILFLIPLVLLIALHGADRVNAATTVGNNVSIGGTLSVTGATTLTGAATIASTLGVTGLSTLTGGFVSGASSSVGGGLRVSGAFNASGTSLFGGNLLPSSNNARAIGAYSTAFSNVFASGTAYVSSTLLENGGPASPSLSFAQDTDTGFFLFAVGGPVALTIDGALEYSFDSSGLTPGGNKANDLGSFYSSANNVGAWKDVYASGTVYVSSTIGRKGGPGSPTYSFAEDSDTGFYLDLTGTPVTALTANGALQYAFGLTGLFPSGNSTHDLGGYSNGTMGAWSNIFASGTLYAASSTYFQTSDTSTIYVKSGHSTRGGRIVLEDTDTGGGCTEISVSDGAITGKSITCPD